VEKSLPIWQLESAILDVLRAGNRLVLAAPTGSGKSTQVPQMLVDGLGFQKVVVLQPRRVAARTLAGRVAWERNSRLGGEVGYQIRFADQTSRGTKISFVTEGILLRWLQDDPELKGIDAVIFDEFHERNLLSDVALGLVKAIQERKRSELKLIVMSATLDTATVAKYLSDAPILVSAGTMFSVEINHLDYGDNAPMPEQAAQAIEEIINSGEVGDILVFMPGMSEIQATIAACRTLRISERVTLIPLHGELPAEDQDKAFAPNSLRKIIVSTNVAETSVTIDGIRHVVDSGVARIARYDPERGIGTLMIEEISRASADQRKGRAGRTAPGTCRRLWTESNHLNRPERNTPEIQRADLAETVLLLHSLGIRKAAEFDWLDKPDTQAVERAEKLLRMLGAISESEGGSHSDLTAIGRRMLKLPMHPRYSRMLIEAAKHGCTKEAALCAALVSGRDLLVRLRRDDKHISHARENLETSDQSDFFVLIEAYKFAQENRFNVEACRRYGIHALSAQQVGMTWGQILDITKTHLHGEEEGGCDAEKLQKCILAGFVDQLCVRKDQGTLDCLLTEGRTGTLMRESVVQKAALFVAASIREISGKSGPLTLLGLATAVNLQWLKEMFPQHFRYDIEHQYDRTHKRVAAIRITRFEDLVVAREHEKDLDPTQSGLTLADAHLEGLFELPFLTHDLKQFIARVNLIAKAAPDLEFPYFDRAALRRSLGLAFHGLFLAKEAQAKELKTAIQSHLAPEQIGWLDELAPQTIIWQEGKKTKLLYPENSHEEKDLNPPEAQVKLNECFALTEHPTICEGKVAVKLWVCSPDGKRIQATTSWPEFRTKEYPKLKPNLQRKFSGFTWL
jgi:ATP-dependent helicase HrpB